MGRSSIEWVRGDDGSLGETWNPVRGCRLRSAGCTNCYAMRQAHRFSGPGGAYEGLTELGPQGPRWTGSARLVPEMLDAPLRWRKPRRVFVNSMSDLFHEALTNEEIAAVFGVMSFAPQHTYQILTKRADRMREWMSRATLAECQASALAFGIQPRSPGGHRDRIEDATINGPWPLPQVWLGVSVEDQQRADERIPLLLDTPAAVRFLSCEPLLGSIDLFPLLCLRSCPNGHVMPEADVARCPACCVAPDRPAIGWCIVGGESGPGARPCDVEWIRSVVRQCREAGTRVFVKQLGAKPRDEHRQYAPDVSWSRFLLLRNRKGGDINEWPADLRVREFPEVRS